MNKKDRKRELAEEIVNDLWETDNLRHGPSGPNTTARLPGLKEAKYIQRVVTRVYNTIYLFEEISDG